MLVGVESPGVMSEWNPVRVWVLNCHGFRLAAAGGWLKRSRRGSSLVAEPSAECAAGSGWVTVCRSVWWSSSSHLLVAVLSITLFGWLAYACAPDLPERLDSDTQEGVRRRKAVPNSYRIAEDLSHFFSEWLRTSTAADSVAGFRSALEIERCADRHTVTEWNKAEVSKASGSSTNEAVGWPGRRNYLWSSDFMNKSHFL